MVVINLWGAPSAGKSTIAAGLFFLMKINQMKVELVTEFAKELVWDRRENMFGDQAYIFTEQNRRLLRLLDHEVDYAITDSPLPLPLFYRPRGYLKAFEPFVLEQFSRYINLNYLVERTHSFETVGRRHNEDESLQIASDLKQFLAKYDIEEHTVESGPLAPEVILADVLRRRPPLATQLPFPTVASARDSSHA